MTCVDFKEIKSIGKPFMDIYGVKSFDDWRLWKDDWNNRFEFEWQWINSVCFIIFYYLFSCFFTIFYDFLPLFMFFYDLLPLFMFF